MTALMTAPVPALPAGSRRTTPRVLIAEDDGDVRYFFRHALRASGLDVLTAGDAFSAETLLRIEPFDIAVLDWWLPGADGLSLCSTIRQIPQVAHIPVVVVTANIRLQPAYAYAAGVTSLLYKPISAKCLSGVIHGLLESS